jgi:pimeloyl-ACP methyl ester carboxylesterase
VASNTQAATAADGRTLTFAEWGDPTGFPVLSLHGTPGSRFSRHYDESQYSAVGARVITYDRPGYGGSHRHSGRRVVDCVDDVAALANALEIERFAVIGGSGGGPHALAVAARLPRRVTKATCAVGIIPYDTPGVDWFEGMDTHNVQEIGWAIEGEQVLVVELEREAAEMLQRIADDPAKIIGDEWDLSDADRVELARTERHDVIRESIGEALRNGVWGWVDDDLCFVQPWGFDVAEIGVPIRIVYGATDVLVPKPHGEWLARNIPGAEVVIEEEHGHIPDPDLVSERYGWLVQA